MTSALVSKEFHPDYPFTVTTDASKFAIRAVLEQEFLDNQHPVAFISKTLNAAEHNYAPYSSEMLGNLFAVNACRCYLH
eukprot:IDg15633t1